MRHFTRSLALAGLLICSTSCLVDDEFLLEEDLFYCASDNDCSEFNYVCNMANNTCHVRPPVMEEMCIDEDGDGWGVGTPEQIARCPNSSAPDPDDTDRTIYPDAPELCDGKDNNGNETIDEPSPCNTASDCPRPTPDGTRSECRANVCTVVPLLAGADPICVDLVISCVDGAYEELPEACQ